MKFLIGFLVSIGLLILVFILIFRGAANHNDQPVPKPLVDYANSSTVMQFTFEGPVSADQTHDEVRITVSDVETAIEIFQGYQNHVVSSRTYANNSAAYADFLRALDLAGYTKGNSDKSVSDERGVCPTGTRYVMGIKNGDTDVQRFWSSTCGNSPSFKGKTTVVRSLFIAQIPDYADLTNNVDVQ